MTTVEGSSTVIETVFENGDSCTLPSLTEWVQILKPKVIAQLFREERSLRVRVIATDLRAGAAMVLAGLVASGTTEVSLWIYHVERGYDGSS